MTKDGGAGSCSQVELRIPSIVSITQYSYISFLHSITSHRLISQFSPPKGSLQSQLNLSVPSSSKHIPPFYGSDKDKYLIIKKNLNHCTANKNCVKWSHYLCRLEKSIYFYSGPGTKSTRMFLRNYCWSWHNPFRIRCI